MEDFVIRRNGFGRWIIVHPKISRLAWSGSRWVEIDQNGLPVGVQVCNFDTASEAAVYAEARSALGKLLEGVRAIAALPWKSK